MVVEEVVNDPAVIEQIVLVVVALFALLGGIIRVFNTRLKTMNSNLEVAKTQLTNNHNTNLRDDLTDVINAKDVMLIQLQMIADQQDNLLRSHEEFKQDTKDSFKRIDNQLSEQHQNLKTETIERQNFGNDSREQHERLWSAIRSLTEKQSK